MTYYLQSLYQSALGATIDFIPQFIGGVFIFFLFYLAYVVSGLVFDRILAKKNAPSIIIVLRKITRMALIIFGLITMLGTWGINTGAMVAGLGVTGFALSFAMKDILASSFASMLILIYKPFGIGDVITVSGVEGKVINIDFRYTTLEAKGAKHLIPNSILLAEKVSVLR
jgi:small conductance mechanosensitive channel